MLKYNKKFIDWLNDFGCTNEGGQISRNNTIIEMGNLYERITGKSPLDRDEETDIGPINNLVNEGFD